MKKTGKERILDICINVLLIITGIVVIYPLWYVLIASFSSPYAIANGEVILWPKGFTLSGYRQILNNEMLWTGYRNTIIYTLASVIMDLGVMTPCAYALSRKSLPFRNFLMT